MKYSIHTKMQLTGEDQHIEFSSPNECPCCGRSVDPRKITESLDSNERLSVLYYCTGCSMSFISVYTKHFLDSSNQPFKFSCSFPKKSERHSFDGRLTTLSPKFEEIYNQAFQAETENLNHIAGMGYRKALEFLIKDYAISLNPQDKTKISNPKYMLNNCIKDYITADNLRDTTKLTAWIGNDETHYTRVHTDKDINDLKQYLDTAIYFILYDLVAKEATSIVNT